MQELSTVVSAVNQAWHEKFINENDEDRAETIALIRELLTDLSSALEVNEKSDPEQTDSDNEDDDFDDFEDDED